MGMEAIERGGSRSLLFSLLQVSDEVALPPKTKEMGDPLSDGSPLVGAASSGKLRLVRLLLEGGAQVNGRNPRGETALLAACKALRTEPAGPDAVKLITYLLQNKADPNAQDQAGCTALMYACRNGAGVQVVSALLAAGGDPSLEDCSGASALVYAINAEHQSTVKVLMDACRARGCDVIILATETASNGDPVTRRYLNVPPSLDNPPLSCTSPSDIVLKAGSPNSPEGENVFDFRVRRDNSIRRHPSCELSPLSHSSRTPAPTQVKSSEPWPASHNLARLNRDHEDGMKKRSLKEKGGEEEKIHFPQSRVGEGREGMIQSNAEGGENSNSCCCKGLSLTLRASQSVLSLTEMSCSHFRPSSSVHPGCVTPRCSVWGEKLPACPSIHLQRRRNTLPSVTVVPPPLHLPPLNQSHSPLQAPGKCSLSKSRTIVSLSPPPSSSPPGPPFKGSARATLLPPLALASSTTSPAAPPARPASCYSERSRSSHPYSAKPE
ncbi:ankyrin repeat domain-containing protein 34B [Cololabis saira]|uniref:ankyrin repeat domain-containing protein 34B n=1 Tax=Cololabis saira TaxID=129043 RepID=UPI002AD31718|nr:ankyrin repeat domain-containing protein 34B [Cololabis saira]